MDHRESLCGLIQRGKAAGGELAEGSSFKLCHQTRDLPGRREGETTLAHVYPPVPAGPGVGASQPIFGFADRALAPCSRSQRVLYFAAVCRDTFRPLKLAVSRSRFMREMK